MKTAVEWLVEQLAGHYLFNTRTGNSFRNHNNMIVIEELIEQSKEMEKERVIDFAKKFSDFNGLTFNEKEVSKEYLEKLYDEYYKETFKSEE